jgi:hypothetical protein
VSIAFYFEITKDILFLTRKIQKNKFCASFRFYLLCASTLVGTAPNSFNLTYGNDFIVYNANFECLIGVIGTRFWRDIA